MKTYSKITLSSVLLASSSALYAIERPTPAAQPTEQQPAQQQAQAQQNLQQPAVPTYLGFLGNKTTPAMAAQMNLKPGVGITLLQVEPNSPIDKAGLKKHDIITKIGDTDITSHASLKKAILDQGPDSKLQVEYLSAGKLKQKIVTPGFPPAGLNPLNNHRPKAQAKRQLDPRIDQLKQRLDNKLGALPLDMLDNIPPAQRQQLQELLEGNLNQLDFNNLDDNLQRLKKQFHGLDNKLGKAPDPEVDINDLMQAENNHLQRIKLVDEEGSTSLATKGDNSTITLHDADGNLLYQGPFNNEADKLKIPENLRARANKLSKRARPNNQQDAGAFLGQLQLRNLNDLNEQLQNFDHLGRLKKHDIGGDVQQQLQEQMENLMKQFEGNPKAKPLRLKLNPAQGDQRFELKFEDNNFQANTSKRLVDKSGKVYTYTQDKHGNTVEVQSPKGALLFMGPYNNESDKTLVPEEYRSYFDQLSNK